MKVQASQQKYRYMEVMPMNTLLQKYRERVAGQSLVETAIFLPVIIILLLGVVEVSNLLVTQNRVSAASRAATGFAATNFTGDEWEETDVWSGAMVRVARNNVTETLDLDENRWDIWTIKGTVNNAGDGFDEWTAIHAFGKNAVMTTAEWDNANIQGDVIAALNESGTVSADKLQIAATVAYHDRHSLLGLNAFNFGELTRVRGLNVMRVEPEPPYLGCALFPISIYYQNISLYPQNFAGTMRAGGEMYDPTAWFHPGNPGAYNDNPYDHSGFPWAVGGHLLEEALSGDIFEARETNDQTVLGAFGWLTWDGSTSSSSLAPSLAYPGNLSLIMDENGNPPPGKVNYDNPHDPYVDSTDSTLKDLIPNPGDWVQGSTGDMASMRDIMDSYVEFGRPMQIVVFDDVEGTGSNFNYRIAGFAIVKLVAYQDSGNDKRILVEFVEWGKSCKAQIAE